MAFRCSTSAPGVCYVGDDPWADDGSCWLDANFTFVARDRYTRQRAGTDWFCLPRPAGILLVWNAFFLTRRQVLRNSLARLPSPEVMIAFKTKTHFPQDSKLHARPFQEVVRLFLAAPPARL